MLGYEWANPEAMLLSSDLSAEEAALEQTQQQLRHYPPYDRGSLGLASMFSPLPPPPVTVAALPGEEGYSLHHRGLLLPPAAAQLQAGGATRIGLNLGERTYFSASHDGDLMQLLGGNALWRPGGVPDVGEGGVYDGLSGNDGLLYTSRARCQADGCVADLAKAKQYHRRHKVCEYHSKAAAVVTDGLTQRFCQQCSRFHLLLEFDHGKRSCRKRLAEHNRRRRKYPPSPAMLPPSPTHPNPTTSSTTLSPPNPTSEDPVVEGPQPSRCGESTATMAATVAPPASPTRMATGLCLGYQQLDGVPGASSSLSTSSPPSCSSSPSWSSSSSVLQHVPQFRPYPPWVSMSLWEAEVTDEYLN